MAAKRVAVVTLSTAVVRFYTEQLYALFGDLIEVIPYSFEDGSAYQIKPADLVIVSTSATESYQVAQQWLPPGSLTIISSITITKPALEQLLALPRGTRALLVNLSLKMAMEVISDLHHLGVNHIEFIPFYPFAEPEPGVDLAITPDEVRYVPSHIKTVINLGQRTFDVSTITEIALKLGYESLLETEPFQRYFRMLPGDNYSIKHLFAKKYQLETRFDMLLSVLDMGVIGVDHQMRIFACNQEAQKILGMSPERVMGKSATETMPFLPFGTGAAPEEQPRSSLVRYCGKHINVSVFPVVRRGEYLGAFALLQDFTAEENKQHKMRAQLLSRGHKAKYTFEDILGASPAIEKTKQIAKKMALTDLPVLIVGESGTGKELFSQAIHNYSPRRDGPFLAINCASIPDTLLESELFGYEEGAFTGAKKGGKLGLFEFAHHGTLLLDEIEGMSPNLQVKLLRVIQEKEVMRVGGNKIIHVDVRLIAASNRNLEEMVESNTFRKDLFYRLNTLPLTIPPLRERGEDILLLLEAIKRSLGISFQLSPAARQAILCYPFPGNVRELINYVEYLSCVGGSYIDTDALPAAIQRHLEQQAAPAPLPLSQPAAALSHMAGCPFLLRALCQEEHSAAGLGRRTLYRKALDACLPLSDHEIRQALHHMQSMGLVSIARGRGATRITPEGRRIAQELERLDAMEPSNPQAWPGT
ncbi:sigma-54 interaction domain-containing protein [Flavonifractor hominis]|uniref:Sigma 54-interacting transcriptional regulator n=1 Tax=Flavonifractor hominis TaxID=3133178 RepID=A0ABV1ES90_9FIRM